MWGRYADASEDEGRWHSFTIGLETNDLLEDALVARLREAARKNQQDKLLVNWISSIQQKLQDYENEHRLLVKLADTGRVVKILQGAITTVLDLLSIDDVGTRRQWWRELEREREARMDMYEASMEDLLSQITWLENEVEEVSEGHFDVAGRSQTPMEELVGFREKTDPLQVLTLLKHGMDKYGVFLSGRELDMISDVFDWVSQQSGLAVVTLPDWFATTTNEWMDSETDLGLGAEKSPCGGGEEGCLRQVAIWSKLQHPHLCRLYGACHVGDPFVINEFSTSLVNLVSSVNPWKRMYGYALGLQYLHDRGVVYQCLSADAFRFVVTVAGRSALLCLGLQIPQEDNARNRSDPASITSFPSHKEMWRPLV